MALVHAHPIPYPSSWTCFAKMDQLGLRPVILLLQVQIDPLCWLVLSPGQGHDLALNLKKTFRLHNSIVIQNLAEFPLVTLHQSGGI